MINPIARMSILVAGAVLAVAAVVTVGSASAQEPTCDQVPYSTLERCDAHLGARVRTQLLDRYGVTSPVADADLGRPVRELCHEGRMVTPDSRLAPISEQIFLVYGESCG